MPGRPAARLSGTGGRGRVPGGAGPLPRGGPRCGPGTRAAPRSGQAPSSEPLPEPPGTAGRARPARVPAAHCPGPAEHRPLGSGPKLSPGLPPSPGALPWAKTRPTGVPEAGRARCSGGRHSQPFRVAWPLPTDRPTSKCLMAVNKQGVIRAHRSCLGRLGTPLEGLWRVCRLPTVAPVDRTAQVLDL